MKGGRALDAANKSRHVEEGEGDIKSVTVSRQAGHWYISTQVELELHSQSSAIPTQPIGEEVW